MAILKLDTIMRNVMASANKEQNQMYPPNVFNTHVNLATKWLIDEAAKVYSTNQSIKDILDPFIEKIQVNVVDGEIKFPEKYRHFLGLSAHVTPDKKNPCNCSGEKKIINIEDDCSSTFDGDPLGKTPQQKKQSQLSRSCASQLIEIVEINEWDDRTTHPYDAPALTNPIGCMFGGGTIKICPYNISSVEVRFIREPKEYVYGYKMMPDDTYQLDMSKTTESEWTSNAESYMYKIMSTLYAGYVRDGDMADYMNALKQIGLF